MNEEQIGDDIDKPKLQNRLLTPLLSKRVPPYTHNDERKPYNEGSNFISKIFVWWITRILRIGYKRTLEPNDLFFLTKDLEVESLTERFEFYFNREYQKHTQKASAADSNSDDTVLLKKVIFWAVTYTFGWRYFWACLYMMFGQLSLTLGPLVSRKLIQFVELHALGLDSDVGKGVGYALGTTLLMFLAGIFLNHGFYQATLVGIQVKAVLTRVMLRKAYKLSERSRIRFPVSKLTSIMGIDLSRVEFGFMYQPFLIVAPVPIGVSIAILVVYIGPSSLVGIGILITLFLAMAIVASSLYGLRKKANVFTDARIQGIKEVLSNLKIVKFYSWESPYYKNISDCRRSEMREVFKMQAVIHTLFSVAMSLVLFSSMGTFLVLYAVGGTRDPSKIFASLSLFGLLSGQLNVLPTSIATGSDTILGIYRVGELLVSEEETTNINDTSIDLELLEKQGLSIMMRDATFEWASKNSNSGNEVKKGRETELQADTTKATMDSENPDASSFQGYSFLGLKNIDLEIKKGEFVVITGLIGSGKTSLLNSISGYMKRTSGSLLINGDLLFSGSPWIQNSTVKDNILFGSEYNAEFYRKVVWACSLESDLEVFPAGDNTEIGERGITLSGGQKARIDLARATYANKDIILLDDVLSAVDAKVGKHIMNNLLLLLLKDKTRILATHQLSLIGAADRVIFVKGDGKIDVGTLEALKENNPDFEKLMDYNKESKVDTNEVNENEEEAYYYGKKNVLNFDEKLADRQISRSKDSSFETDEESLHIDYNKNKSETHNLILIEEKAVNSIKLDVYKSYFKEGSGIFPKYSTLIAVIIFISIETFCMIFTQTWLSFWISQKFKTLSNGAYIGLYVMFSVLALVFLLLESLALVYLTNRASVELNIASVKRILHSPMSFIDTTPMGRVLNRFTKDINTIDSQIGVEFRMCSMAFAQVVGTVILCVVYIPYFIISVPILLFLVIIVGNLFQASAREIVRIEAVQRSRIYDTFNESLDGQSTIKAFKSEDRFFKKLDLSINKTNEASYLFAANQCWMGLSLDIVGSIFVLLIGLLCVNRVFNISGASTGLLLTYALEMVQLTFLLIRHYTEIENIMNSVERLNHYATSLPQEAAYVSGSSSPEEGWPQRGAINFNKASMAYRPGLPLVLKDITMDINGGEKIGVCGRTGAGKSSIMNVIFRLQELNSGSILIDGIDISKLGLHVLRSKLSIIPQESVLFEGTIRKNLDPFGEYSDDHLWDSLLKSGIIEASKIENVKDQSKDDVNLHKFHLEHVVDEKGDNFSLGERQLISFARAVVRDSKILILDEATSSVDYETDEKIQANIAKVFSQSTILCVAHRLRTILSYDRIIVMDRGEIKELGTPLDLFTTEDSLFRQMCFKSGISTPDFERLASK